MYKVLQKECLDIVRCCSRKVLIKIGVASGRCSYRKVLQGVAKGRSCRDKVLRRQVVSNGRCCKWSCCTGEDAKGKLRTRAKTTKRADAGTSRTA